MNHRKITLKQVSMLAFFYCAYHSSAYAEQRDLMQLSVEDLLNIEVISVAKKAKSLNDSPAAIYVITQEDIKRIGATSIPEALRLAPGLDVARIDANKWAVSARGFNGRFANKLLVLIDGRNIYSRTFAGVYWENQDIMLEDVDRIEVIRGPGATLWGANAMNGVINIITKHSAETQGGLLVAGAGTEELGFGALRYGLTLNKNTTARAYLKGFKRADNKAASGKSSGDDWDKIQGGFRLDSQLTHQDNLTFQGDVYHSLIHQETLLPQLSAPYQSTLSENIHATGGNLLMRHQHTFSSTSDYSLQIFYDFYQRDENLMKESQHVLDLEFQHRFSVFDWNDVVWGLGYRYNHNDFSDHKKHLNTVTPLQRNDQLVSTFIQDEITLWEDTLWLTLGSKFEHNDYSGFEIQPTARLMWIPHHQHRVWGAISRAVRTPSRLQHDSRSLVVVNAEQAPPQPVVALFFQGDRHFDSETVISYELGYRTTWINNVSIDFTAFYNDYKHLISVQQQPPVFNSADGVLQVTNTYSNNTHIKTYGFEIATVWQMLDWWRWDANYSLLKTVLNNSDDPIFTRPPQQSFSLRSILSPWESIDFDLFFRYIDRSTVVGASGKSVINHYVSMDLRLAWRPTAQIELSLVGQNLLAKRHLEYRQAIFITPTQIDRGVYGKLSWQF